MLHMKSEGVMEKEETEKMAELQVGTDSVDESENRQMTQEERVKIKVDKTTVICGHNVYKLAT